MTDALRTDLINILWGFETNPIPKGSTTRQAEKAIQGRADRILAVLDAQPEPDEHIEDDVWDRDLRHLLTDSID